MKLRWTAATDTYGRWYLEHQHNYGFAWPYVIERDPDSRRWIATYRGSVFNPTTVGEFATREEAQNYCEVCYRMGVHK